jgi:hypothetical protein
MSVNLLSATGVRAEPEVLGTDTLAPLGQSPVAPPPPAARPSVRPKPAAPVWPTLALDPKDPNKLRPQTGVVNLAISPNLEHDARGATHAIVLHMTGGSATSTLSGYANGTPVGAHFLIAKDGTIYQTARMGQKAYHVGNVRPKGLVPTAAGGNRRVAADLDADSQAVLKLYDAKKISFGEAVKRLSRLEAAKPYGNDPHDAGTRLPMNADSIGIEFEALVGKDGKYEALTDAQRSSGAALLDLLKTTYGLTSADVYAHPDVSYKQYTEGRVKSELEAPPP